MKTSSIRYGIKTATENEIFLHLTACSDSFVPPLAQRVNIIEYAQKIFEKSVTIEAWAGQLLVGLIAVYFNVVDSAFITNVSVLKEFSGYGIASKMMDMCIENARTNNFHAITLEVDKYNKVAIRLYRKFRFIVNEIKGDTFAMKRQI